MSLKKYTLYSNTQTCPPCRMLKKELDLKFPTWMDHINYIDINNMTGADISHIVKVGVKALPSFTDETHIISTGFSPDKLKKIIELCTQG